MFCILSECMHTHAQTHTHTLLQQTFPKKHVPLESYPPTSGLISTGQDGASGEDRVRENTFTIAVVARSLILHTDYTLTHTRRGGQYRWAEEGVENKQEVGRKRKTTAHSQKPIGYSIYDTTLLSLPFNHTFLISQLRKQYCHLGVIHSKLSFFLKVPYTLCPHKVMKFKVSYNA